MTNYYRVGNFYGDKGPTPIIPIDVNPLPILPVRYCVLPSVSEESGDGERNSHPDLLPPQLKNKVNKVNLHSYHYDLRMMRPGYVYIYYEKEPRYNDGKDFPSWDVFEVTSRGSFLRQALPWYVKNGGPTEAIYIQHPYNHEKVWLAFSDHPWSKKTLRALDGEDGKDLRNRRMQCFSPAKWIESTSCPHQHAIELSSENLDKYVLEYRDDEHQSYKLLTGDSTAKVSELDEEQKIKPSGVHNRKQIEQVYTRYDLKMDVGNSKKLIGKIKRRTVNSIPALIALDDNVGIALELNGFRNDPTGHIAAYNKEHEIRFDAINSLKVIRNIFEEKTAASLQKRIPRGIINGDYLEEFISKKIQEAYEKGKERSRNDYQIIPIHLVLSAEQLERHKKRNGSRPWFQIITPEERELREQALEKAKIKAQENWDEYKGKIGDKKIETFENNKDLMMEQAQSLIDLRTSDLIKWLKSPLLFDALSEYHQESIGDGIGFEGVVGDLIEGIATSPKGEKILKEWFTQGSISEDNLLWRALILNQQDLIAEGEKIAAYIVSNNQPLTTQGLEQLEAEFDFGVIAKKASKVTKYIAKLYKGGVYLHNANREGGVRPVRGRGFEKIFLTMGNGFFKSLDPIASRVSDAKDFALARGVDALNKKLIQSFLLFKVNVNPSAVWEMAKSNCRNNNHLAEKLRSSYTQNPKLSDALKELDDNWKHHLDDAYKPSLADPHTGSIERKPYSGVTEMRAVTVIAAMEAFNLFYLVHKGAPEDPVLKAKFELELKAASFGTLAAVCDMVAYGIETAKKGHSGLYAPSFQAFKLLGGGFAMVASFYGSNMDWGKAKKLDKQGETVLANLHYVSAISQAISGASYLLGASSYATSLLTRTGVMSAGAASRLVYFRAFCMLSGLGFTALTIAASIAIWYFGDDELDDWLDACAFAKNPEKAYRDIQEQQEGLSMALYQLDFIGKDGKVIKH